MCHGMIVMLTHTYGTQREMCLQNLFAWSPIFVTVPNPRAGNETHVRSSVEEVEERTPSVHAFLYGLEQRKEIFRKNREGP